MENGPEMPAPTTTSAATALPQADPMVPSLGRVVARRDEIAGIVTLEIEAPGWAGFLPGQFNMLGRPGLGEIAISLSGPAEDAGRIVHTIRDVGAVSHGLSSLAPGDPILLRGPYGAPWPVAAAEGADIVVIAGGLGLAPVRPILYHVLAHRDRYGQVSLLYGTRSPDDILYRAELARWRGRFDMTVEVTVDHAQPGWHGDVGVVTRLVSRAGFDPAKTRAFVCGPEIMMRFAANELTDAGLPETAIHLSMERNMECGIGLCGHCQLGPYFVCRDGPVFDWGRMRPLMAIKEL